MSAEIESRLKELGIDCPWPQVPVAHLCFICDQRKTLYISGQLPLEGGKVAVNCLVGF